MLTLDQARANRQQTDWDNAHIAVPWFVGRRVSEPSLDELIPFLPRPETRQIDGNAQAILARIVREKRLTARGVYGFWPANSVGDDVVVYRDDARRSVVARFHTLRQQQTVENNQPSLSLADFVAPRESMAPDYIGAYAVTAGIGIDELAREYEGHGDNDGATIVRVIADQFAEAFADYLHAQARNDWGYAHGIRPAFGSATCPDRSEMTALFALLDAPQAGIELTDTYATQPGASVCGLYFAHPQATHFDVTHIGPDQLADYAGRKGISLDQAAAWLAPLL